MQATSVKGMCDNSVIYQKQTVLIRGGIFYMDIIPNWTVIC